jgi:HEAT repeat protein
MYWLDRYPTEQLLRVFTAMLDSPDQEARLAAIRTLGHMGERAHTALKRALECEHEDVRTEAALLMCEQGQVDGFDILAQLNQDIPTEERPRFINAVAKSGHPRAASVLIRFLEGRRCYGLAVHALYTMGATACSELRLALTSPSSRMRLEAALLLCSLCQDEGSYAGAQVLLEAVEKQKYGPRLRRAAVRKLSLVKDSEITARLASAALTEPDDSVRKALTKVLVSSKS